LPTQKHFVLDSMAYSFFDCPVNSDEVHERRTTHPLLAIHPQRGESVTFSLSCTAPERTVTHSAGHVSKRIDTWYEMHGQVAGAHRQMTLSLNGLTVPKRVT